MFDITFNLNHSFPKMWMPAYDAFLFHTVKLFCFFLPRRHHCHLTLLIFLGVKVSFLVQNDDVTLGKFNLAELAFFYISEFSCKDGIEIIVIMPNFCKTKRFLQIDVVVGPLDFYNGDALNIVLAYCLLFFLWLFPCSLWNVCIDYVVCLAFLLAIWFKKFRKVSYFVYHDMDMMADSCCTLRLNSLLVIFVCCMGDNTGTSPRAFLMCSRCCSGVFCDHTTGLTENFTISGASLYSPIL